MTQELEIRDLEGPVETQTADVVPMVDGDDTQSVEDFIKELEAKEKDLHIGADYQIEISDGDFDFAIVPDLTPSEPAASTPPQTAMPTPSVGSKTRAFELEQELESLKNKLNALKMERDDVLQKSDRRLKDFESYKYRMDRERRGAFITQVGNVATQLLPVLDNLDRALESVSGLSEQKRNEFSQFFDGIALVHQQINDVLGGMGVEPIATVGEAFDPHFHEAVVTEESTEQPPHTICAEMLRGYRIGNLVIRHSMVKVTMPPAPPPKTKKKAESKQSAPTDEATSEEPTATSANPPHNAE